MQLHLHHAVHAAAHADAELAVQTADVLGDLKLGNGTSILITANIASALPTSVGAAVQQAASKDSANLIIYSLALFLTTLGVVYVQVCSSLGVVGIVWHCAVGPGTTLWDDFIWLNAHVPVYMAVFKGVGFRLGGGVMGVLEGRWPAAREAFVISKGASPSTETGKAAVWVGWKQA